MIYYKRKSSKYPREIKTPHDKLLTVLIIRSKSTSRLNETMTPATGRTNLVFRKPLLHMNRMTTVSANNTTIRTTAHWNMTDGAIQHQLLATDATAVFSRLQAVLTVGEELHTSVNLAGAAHVFEDLCSFVEQPPTVQRLGVSQFVVFVEGRRGWFLRYCFYSLFE